MAGIASFHICKWGRTWHARNHLGLPPRYYSRKDFWRQRKKGTLLWASSNNAAGISIICFSEWYMICNFLHLFLYLSPNRRFFFLVWLYEHSSNLLPFQFVADILHQLAWWAVIFRISYWHTQLYFVAHEVLRFLK